VSDFNPDLSKWAVQVTDRLQLHESHTYLVGTPWFDGLRWETCNFDNVDGLISHQTSDYDTESGIQRLIDYGLLFQMKDKSDA